MLLFEPLDINPSFPVSPGVAYLPGLLAPAQKAGYPATLPITEYHNITGGALALPACGEPIRISACENPEHQYRVVFHSCGRRECRVCWPTWGKRATTRAADRVEGFRDASGARYPPRHIPFSPPPGAFPEGTGPEESQASIDALLKNAREMVRVAGLTGMVVVPHAWRIQPEKQREVNDGASQSGTNRYRWVLNQENPRDYLIWSPHVHVLGWGRLMDADEFSELTGWIYKNKGARETRADLERTIYYLLSHAWVGSSGANTMRYWGDLAPNKLKVTEAVTWEPETCPVCGGARHRVPVYPGVHGYFFTYQDIRNAPQSRVKVISRTYRLNQGAPSKPQVSWWFDEEPPTGWRYGGRKRPVP